MSGINLVLIKSTQSTSSIKCWRMFSPTKPFIQQWVTMKQVQLSSRSLLCIHISTIAYTAPCNLFPTPNIRSENISWLYEVLADSWIKLGLPADTHDSILYGGFYTTVIRPGLRLISLNMNYCDPNNYWLFINATDPLDQLQWVSITRKTKQHTALTDILSSYNGCNMPKTTRKKSMS